MKWVYGVSMATYMIICLSYKFTFHNHIVEKAWWRAFLLDEIHTWACISSFVNEILFMPIPWNHKKILPGICYKNTQISIAIKATVLTNSQKNTIADALTPIDLITDAQNSDEDENSSKPEFVNKVPSLSITRGKDAVMRCTVKNLGNNVVSFWYEIGI